MPYVLKSTLVIYTSLTEVRSVAINHAIRTNKQKEYIDVIRTVMGDEVLKPLGYVAIKTTNGKKHFLWASGPRSNWRILDRYGKVVRLPTKADRELWGI